MTTNEVLMYFDGCQAEIARALHVSANAVSLWFKSKKIPYARQCQIEVVTRGALKAKKDHGSKKYDVTR